MSLVFYYSPFSSATTAHWALEELGIPYEKKKIDFKLDTKKPEFLAMNPNGKVPLLVHDGTPIFESVAIIAYLGETFGAEKKLFPAPGPQRGQALSWLVWTNVSLGGALSRYSLNSSDRVPKEEHNAKAAELGKADVEKHLDILAAAIKGKKFLVGDTFTLVDLHVSGFCAYLGMVGFDLTKWPAVEAWVKSSSERPARAKVWKPDA